MDKTLRNKWFEDWFNSPYYHILYKQRNFKEAELFIDNLIEYLHPKENARFLDLGCGKGRHSVYLNKKHFEVTGFDLSPQSIEWAKQYENESVHFYVQDMRKPFLCGSFDYIVNMFTSFGYFENEAENYATIEAVSNALNTKGIFVLDFLNVEKVIPTLVAHQSITMDDIEFNIYKKFENNFIVKQISFNDNGKEYNFEEKVSALKLADFEKYFTAGNLKILDIKGDYMMNDFNLITSERLILIAQKVK